MSDRGMGEADAVATVAAARRLGMAVTYIYDEQGDPAREGWRVYLLATAPYSQQYLLSEPHTEAQLLALLAGAPAKAKEPRL